MAATTNYGLAKPADNETADIAVLNQNADTIDAEIKKTNDRVKTDVPAGAKFTDTIYTHPDNATTRHVTDAEKAGWNGKADGSHVATSVNTADGVHGLRWHEGILQTWNGAQWVNAAPLPPIVYGVKIDTTNSNPASALTYTDDAVGFAPASGNNGSFNYGSWQDKFPFNQIKPCLYKNGVVNYYLSPNDYTKKLDGSASDITSGNDGDVMVEFPKIYWKFETIGTDLYIRYSDVKVDSGYKCLAHMRGTTEKDKCYISAYMGYNLSSKLRSLSGKTPTVSQTIGTFRTQAQANGTGYDQMAYYQLLMLQVLFIVMFKNRDSQTALGRGYVNGNSAAIVTGGTNTKGMFYGETTGKLQNKFCGIEDFWGNVNYFIDGFFIDVNRNMLIGNQNFNDAGSGYTNYGQGATNDFGGYISTVQGGTETGFIVKANAGSVTTYYCDYGWFYASCIPCFGGDWSNTDFAGPFHLSVSYTVSISSSSFGCRLFAL